MAGEAEASPLRTGGFFVIHPIFVFNRTDAHRFGRA
jgi:hypothetical protein